MVETAHRDGGEVTGNEGRKETLSPDCRLSQGYARGGCEMVALGTVRKHDYTRMDENGRGQEEKQEAVSHRIGME